MARSGTEPQNRWLLSQTCYRLRDISGPEYRWALEMGQRPISHSLTYKNQDFDGPFCILMGLLEKMMGPKILTRHLTAKLTSNLNGLCMGPNQKLKQIYRIYSAIRLVFPLSRILRMSEMENLMAKFISTCQWYTDFLKLRSFKVLFKLLLYRVKNRYRGLK